jgi:hypothetical protein
MQFTSSQALLLLLHCTKAVKWNVCFVFGVFDVNQIRLSLLQLDFLWFVPVTDSNYALGAWAVRGSVKFNLKQATGVPPLRGCSTAKLSADCTALTRDIGGKKRFINPSRDGNRRRRPK